MANTNSTYRNLKPKSTAQITLISLLALFLAHLMLLGSMGSLLFGVLITSFFIYQNTLGKNDLFSFITVMYFCSTFPYLIGNGGAFNLVCFICIALYYSSNKKFPTEKRLGDPWFNRFVGLIVLSSLLGWIFNYTGTITDFIYSFWSFFGVIFVLLLSSRLVITRERIKVFLQLNFVLIIYSTISSLNAYLSFIPFTTPMMPIYQGGGAESGYFEAGGIVGVSPFYGEHNMVLLILFTVFLFFTKKDFINKPILIAGVLLASINIFMSISRSVFLLALAGIALVILFQFKLKAIRKTKVISQIVLIIFLGYSVFFIVNRTGLGYVFNRIEEIENRNKSAGGVSLDRIIDGSAFNRYDAFDEGYKRYASKDSWIIGYGWALEGKFREAIYIDPTIKRGSAHSQIIAVLFLFGWVGFIGYWGLIFRIIFKSYKTIGSKNIDYTQKTMAFFFMIALFSFVLNEVKVDSISFPSYFAVTIIWVGLAYSTVNYKNQKSSPVHFAPE